MRRRRHPERGYQVAPIEIVTAEGQFDYTAKYLAKSTQEICPARFPPEVNARLMDEAVRAHRVLSCRGYSRSDFIVSDKSLTYLETNTLPGLTAASLFPKMLKAQGIDFREFLLGQIALAEARARRWPPGRPMHGCGAWPSGSATICA